MKIYTKTGDQGMTGLVGGTRVQKNDVRIEAYGTVDELNSLIGWLASYEFMEFESEFLSEIQHLLFSIGSNLATDRTKVTLNSASIIADEDILKIENEIDRLGEDLPELRAFILPGGTPEGSLCHVCRTVSRRAERRILDISNDYDIDNQIIKYINRLSDYFFVLSRYVTIRKGGKEILWKK